jgi:AraC-like DNA-binding protein
VTASVPNHFVPALGSIAVRFRISPEHLFTRAGFDLTSARAPGSVFSVLEVERLVDALIELTGIAHLGLLLGTVVEPSTLGLFGQLVVTAPTPRESIATFSRFKYLLHPLFDLRIEQTAEHDVVRYVSSDTMPIGDKPYYAEALLSTVVTLCRIVGAAAGTPRFVTFRHARPAYAAEYTRLFRCDVRFGAEHDTLVAPHTDLDTPSLASSPRYHLLLRAQAEDELARNEPLVVAQLRRVILARLGTPELSLAEVAKQLAMSARTLQRQLGAVGMSYHQLRDRVRHHEARRLLDRPGLTIEQVAAQLGYTDRSNFTRAFARWEGRSPRSYRRRDTGP